MKKIIILIMTLFLTGCTHYNENEVNILNWSSYIPSSVITDFENETGIKVNYGTYSSNEELLAKVSSAKEGTYDLIFPSDYMVQLMIERNLIDTLDKTRLENYKNVKENYLNLEFDKGNGYSVPFLAATTVIAVNRENITNKITSYNDLLNPQYKNNIVLLDDQRIVIGMALQALGYSMNETSIDKLNEAKEWFLKLKPNIKAFDSDSPKTFLISKETDIAVLWNAEAAIAHNENSNIEIIYPADGFVISLDNFAIPISANHKDNAYKFIDYILRSDVMRQIIEDYPYVNVNKETEPLLSEEYINNKASNIPNNVIKKATFVNNIGSSIKKYDKLWAEIK